MRSFMPLRSVLACAVLLAARPAGAAVITVDDDNVECFDATHHTITSALDVANAGDEIRVCPGVYAEQVVVARKHALRGVRIGSNVPIIRPTALPGTRPSLFGGSAITAAVIVDTPRADVSDFVIDLSQNPLAGCSPVLTGLYMRNASGKISGVEVHGARVAMRPDCETGVGVLVESGVTDVFGDPILGKAKVAISGGRMADCQKSGIVALGDRSTVRATGTGVQGAGPTWMGPAQNGFEFNRGARGGVQDVLVQDVRSPGTDALAAAVLVFGGQKVRIRGMTAVDVQVGAFLVGDRNKVLSTQIGNVRSDGVIVLGDANKVAGSAIDVSSVSGVFVDGEANRVVGGTIANVPVGVWFFDGSGHVAKGITFVDVPERERVGGSRSLTADDADPFDPACTSDAACDDGNPCTTDACETPAGRCTSTNVADATPCSDGSMCNGDETCTAGVCTAGVPLTCDDGSECTDETCDPILGCQSSPLPDGTACNGGLGTCTGGACA